MRNPQQREIFSLFILSLYYGKPVNKIILGITSTVIVGVIIAADYPCDGWEPYKDEKCFKIFDSVGLQTYEDAKKACYQNEIGATLVSINSLEEQNFLSNFFFNTNKVLDNVWIGATYNSNKFNWVDGSDVSFTNWADGSPRNESEYNCVQMISDVSPKGKWVNAPCGKKNLVVCQKMQIWSISHLQKTLLDVKKELKNTLEDNKKELDKVKNELYNTRNELNATRHELERMINQRTEGVEGAYVTSFDVGGSVNYYYPVAFGVHHQSDRKGNPRTPLVYDIYRAYYEKPAPESLNDGHGHYIGLTLKLMCTGGGWDAGANALKVLLHSWVFKKGVAKIQLFYNQEHRLFVWLRGGGIRYYIRSPIDLTQQFAYNEVPKHPIPSITVYLENNTVASPAFEESPAVIINPISEGNEDPNLVKTGVYDGWGF